MGMPPADNPIDAMAQLAYTGRSDQIAYASWWARLAAAIIDVVFVRVVLFAIFFVIGLITGVAAVATGSVPASTASTGVEVLADIIYFILYAGYFVYFWGMGQTPGMRVLRIFVADATTGGPIGFGRAGTRFAGYVLSVLACFVGLIGAAFDARKQGWHDKFAGSVVLKA
jgi:uncharacterized RDD family membrane protein YckC